MKNNSYSRRNLGASQSSFLHVKTKRPNRQTLMGTNIISIGAGANSMSSVATNLTKKQCSSQQVGSMMNFLKNRSQKSGGAALGSQTH